MDIMMPKLFWIDGAYFRDPGEIEGVPDEDPEDFITGEDNDVESEEMTSSAPVKEYEGKFRAILDIPSDLYGFVIGRRGASLDYIQTNTDCRVSMPGPRNQLRCIEVVGERRRDVVRASNMITAAAERGRAIIKPSHFLALRLATKHVCNRMETFKAAALDAGGRGVVPELFQDAERMHLTLCMLTLLSEPERARVCSVLTEHEAELRAFVPRSGLSIRVRELDIMNDDASEVRVLYARVQDTDGSGCLQRLADRCLDLMLATGLASKEKGRVSVKLHCTLMNTSFLVRDLEESNPRHQELNSSTFDASAVIKELGQFDFGTVAISELEVVQRQARDDTGFYLPIGSLSLRA